MVPLDSKNFYLSKELVDVNFKVQVVGPVLYFRTKQKKKEKTRKRLKKSTNERKKDSSHLGQFHISQSTLLHLVLLKEKAKNKNYTRLTCV